MIAPTQVLDGLVALVTGGSRGIGAAICRALAGDGAGVSVNYRTSKTQADRVAADIVGNGGRAVVLQGDVADYRVATELVRQTIAEFGRLDILVNNAGIADSKLLRDCGPHDWAAVMGVNFGGVFNCTKAAMEYFSEHRRGSIINISSVMDSRGWVGESVYAASKGAVSAFTRCCALEAAPFDIRVNAVLPGFTETDLIGRYLETATARNIRAQIPARRFAEPEHIAEVVRFLASSRAEYLNGALIPVDGGITAALGRGRPVP